MKQALVELRGARVERPGLRDGLGRRIEYLRISVTDKCNLRCVYCMPAAGLPWLKRTEVLTYEELGEVVSQLAPLGLRRVRITGGEPLVRRDLARLVARIRAVPAIEDLSLSTNGVLLAEQAEALRAAGLDRVNVSLDSLRPERLDAIVRRPGAGARILRGLEAAERAGLSPLKINCVVMRGHNDDEVADFAALTRERPWHVRFIELMPLGGNLALSKAASMSGEEILERVRGLGELLPARGPVGNGPATSFSFPGAKGTVGVITPLSHGYCDRCNRLRLTADGQLRPCLFGPAAVNLRDALRRGEPLEPLLREALRIKPAGHQLVRGSAEGSAGLAALSEVGG